LLRNICVALLLSRKITRNSLALSPKRWELQGFVTEMKESHFIGLLLCLTQICTVARIKANLLQVKMCNFFFPVALQLLWGLAASQFSDLFTIGRTPWRSDQARRKDST
jgi:hypothetical protein